jgi:ATP-dependent DNA ligase
MQFVALVLTALALVEVLRNAFDFQGSLRFTEHRERDGEAYYREACRSGWEGVIARKWEKRLQENA